MFNLYQTMNRHAEGKEQKEPETTGHDRFYQERSGRSSYRKKRKPACRRAQSAAELNPSSIAAANKRAAFRAKSVSTENESEEEGVSCGVSSASGEKAPLVAQKIDSLAKLLFNKSIIGSPSGSLKGSPVEENNIILRDGEKTLEKTAASNICMQYLDNTTRYEFISQLNDIGSRPDKHWFAIKDCSIKTERLLTLAPLTAKCPIEPTERSRNIIIELFRALHHPYIYPVLDVAFYSGHALAIIPFNPKGSLKDLIYKTQWRDDWYRKHGDCDGRSNIAGLPLWQVGTLGRQVLEGLLFLAERGFPPFRHLRSANVILQNGVARISGLENTLFGLNARNVPWIPATSPYPEVLALGHLLFEMCAGYELDCPAPTQGHLQLDLERYPQVVEILEVIFQPRTPNLAEVVLCDLFRKIDLREMKGSCLPNFNQRLSSSCAGLLGQVARVERNFPGSGGLGRNFSGFYPRSAGCSPVATPPPRRRHHTTDDFESCWYS